MKRHTYVTKVLIILLSAAITAGCAGTQKNNLKQDAGISEKKQTSLIAPPERLIADYSDMQEQDGIAWAWFKSGFTFSRCRSLSIAELQNISRTAYPWAEKKINGAMHSMLSPLAQGDTGSLDIDVKVALVGLKTKPGLLKRLFPSIEDYPYIEIEMVMYERHSQTILFKLCHFSKGKDFSQVMDSLIEELTIFFKQA
ncbi:MAG: hypothetical protein GY868_18280 [Deltaproteobacteria bacterium]|nr:hypothetical protein [Deltaproteobacteria bacterium]